MRSTVFESDAALLRSPSASERVLRVALCVMLLTVQSVPWAAESEDAADTPKLPARLRLFGQNGVMVTYYPGRDCYGGRAGGIKVSGSAKDALASFVGKASNKSIGMPASPNTESLSARDGLMSKAYFREYTMVPDRPVAVSMSFSSGSLSDVMSSCRAIAVTFVPEQGKDYEAALDVGQSQCQLMLRELRRGDAGVTLVEVPFANANVCQ